MWMEKLTGGVLRVLTPLGSRYIQLSFFQRIYLLWMFRHFPVLPHQVLNVRQQRLIDELCAHDDRFLSLMSPSELDVPIIGTLEHRPPIVVESVTPSRQTVGKSSMADLRQRS
jgi:hypothetical protein